MVQKYFKSGVDFLLDFQANQQQRDLAALVQALANNQEALSTQNSRFSISKKNLFYSNSTKGLNTIPIHFNYNSCNNSASDEIKWRFWKWIPSSNLADNMPFRKDYGSQMSEFKDHLQRSENHLYTINELRQFSILELSPIVDFVLDENKSPFFGQSIRSSTTARSFYIFEEGVRPLWEDEYNLSGGRWTYQFSARTICPKQMWKLLIMILSDQSMKSYLSEDICGAGLTIKYNSNTGRNMCKIAIWIRDSSNTLVTMLIGETFKSLINHPRRIQFCSHLTSIKQKNYKHPSGNKSPNPIGKKVSFNIGSDGETFVPGMRNSSFNDLFGQSCIWT